MGIAVAWVVGTSLVEGTDLADTAVAFAEDTFLVEGTDLAAFDLEGIDQGCIVEEASLVVVLGTLLGAECGG